MKFAKDLEELAVPEWKSKYLDYKKGKKKLKAVTKAIRDIDSKSPPGGRKPNFSSPFTSLRDAPVKNLLRRSPATNGGAGDDSLAKVRSMSEAPPRTLRLGETDDNAEGDAPRGRAIPVNERSPLRTPRPVPRMTRYGSIIGSPPKDQESDRELRPASTLELPMPSIDPEYDRPLSPTQVDTMPSAQTAPPETPMMQTGIDPFSTPPRESDKLQVRYPGVLPKRTTRSLDRTATAQIRKPLTSRLFSFAAGDGRDFQERQGSDIPLQEYQELDFRKSDFIMFLDKELAKIELFYQEKEDEGSERLRMIREQLHIMRYWRLQDIQQEEPTHRHLSAISNIGHDTIGKTSHSMAQLGTPLMPAMSNSVVERQSGPSQDYERRKRPPVKYTAAKRQLKTAMHQLYRSCELLKSYSTLNQKAFRKITKKYNKTVANTDPEPTNFMSEKVNMAHFIKSDLVDELMRDIEGKLLSTTAQALID